MYGIDQRTNTALPCLLCSPRLPWRHCLSCLYVGPLAWSWWNCLLFVASPGRICGQWSIECVPGQISLLLAVAFHSIKLPISSPPDTQKRERGSEEKEGNALQCMYSEARSRLKDGPTFLFLCQRCQVEQVVISRVSLDDIIPHVGGKIKPSHTHKYQERGNIVTVLSASLRSQWFRFHSHITPQGTKVKPDLCSYRLVIAAVVASQIIS